MSQAKTDDTTTTTTESKDSESTTNIIEDGKLYNVGDYVELQGNKKNTTRKGYIRFKGKIESFGDCVGIELDDKITDGNDGKFNDKEYFQCEQGKGTFIKIAKIIQKLQTPLIENKKSTENKEVKENKDDESFPAAPADQVTDKSEEDQIKKPKKKKKKKKKKATTDKSGGTGKKGKKSTTSSSSSSSLKDKKGASAKKGASKRGNATVPSTKAMASNSNSKKKTGSKSTGKKKKEKKEINFTIPSSGTNQDKLKFIYSRIADVKSPFKKRSQIMKNTIPIIEDEKCDDATAKYAIDGYKKCFVVQLTDRKNAVHIQACNLLNAMIKSQTKAFKQQTIYYLKHLMKHLEKSDPKSASAAEDSIKLIMKTCTVKDNKQLGAIIAEFIRFGSSAKNKTVRKHSWSFIGQMLKRYEPKKGGKTKKPPKAILDALQTGLKQGLADPDKATQKAAMNVLTTISMIDETRAERISARMSPAAKRSFDQLTGNKGKKNKGGKAKGPLKKTKPTKTTPSSSKPAKKGTGKKGTGKKGKDSKLPNGSTKMERTNSKTAGKKTTKGGKTKDTKGGKTKDGKTTKGGAAGSKKKGTKGGKKTTTTKTDKGEKSKTTKDTTKDTKAKDEVAVTAKDDDSKTKEEQNQSKDVKKTEDKSKDDDGTTSNATEESVTSQETDDVSTTSDAGSNSAISESTTTEAYVKAEAKDDDVTDSDAASTSVTKTEDTDASMTTDDDESSVSTQEPSLIGDNDPEQMAAALETDIPDEDKVDKEKEQYLLTREKSDSESRTESELTETADDDEDDEDEDEGDDDDDSDEDESDDESSDGSDADEDIIGGQSSENDARDLIESFLDLKDPQINWKMIEFLSKDNMTHLLMSYISRMPQGPKIWQENLDVNFDDVIPPTLPLYSDESDEIRATQLSYSLMRILSNEHAAETVKSFLLRKCQEICLHALAVFHPLSKGNVYHGRVVLEILLNHWPKSFMAALANQRHIQSLLKCALFRNLHQGNLNSFFLDLICFRPNTKIGQIQPVKKKLMKMFVDWQFMEYLLSASCDPKHGDDVATKYSTFFIDMVARCASIQEAGELFKGHEHLIIDSFMAGLLDKEKSRTVWHRISCGQTLVQFLDISSRPTIMDPASAMAGMLGVVAPDPNPNVLHPMFEDSLKRLHSYIPQMCDTICNKENQCKSIRLASGDIPKPFGQVKLNCLELLTVSADFAQFKCGHVLGLLELDFWEELLTMSFIHNQNNMYLCHFRRLIHLSMIFRRRFLKHLFVKCQMLERFVDFYENKPHPRTTLHGYILQMLWDIYNHDQRDEDDDEDENKENDDDGNEEEEEEEQRDSVVINSTPKALVDEDDIDIDTNDDNDNDNDKDSEQQPEPQANNSNDDEDEFGDDVVLKPNFSKEPEDQWDIVAFFHSSEVWKQFLPTVSMQMDQQNATETQPPNMNVDNNQKQLDQLLQNLLGPTNDDTDSTDSDSDSEED